MNIRRLPGSTRARLLAVGAAVAATAGAGALLADTSGPNDLVLVPVTPCRLFDTQPGPGHVGTRNTPIATAAFVFDVAGTCGVPVDAKAVDVTVTVLSATVSSARLTVFPAGTSRPARSSIDGAGARKVVPLTVALPASGKLAIQGSAGRTHIAVDVTGFRAPHDHDERYPTKAEADLLIANPGPAGDRGPAGTTTGPQGPAGDQGPAGAAGQAAGQRLGHSTATLAGAGANGQYTSATIGTDGMPVISSQRILPGGSALQVTHCNDIACVGDDETTTLYAQAAVATVGSHSSITIGSDGFPVVSFYNAGALALLHCTDTTCRAGDVVTLDSAAPDVGQYTSIAIARNGFPIVSYYDLTNTALRVAVCSSVTCSARTARTLDNAADVGRYSSIMMTGDGRPLVSYYDATNGNLKTVRCEDDDCAAGLSIVTLDGSANDVGLYTSITLGADTEPIISYFDATANALKVAHCDSTSCSAVTPQTGAGVALTTVAVGGVGTYSAISIGSDALPVISARNTTTGALTVVHCNDVACTGGNESRVDVDDPVNLVGRYTSVTIGVDGFPLVSYVDETSQLLKIAHCSNVFCTPFARGR